MKYLSVLSLLALCVACDTIPRKLHEEKINELSMRNDELKLKANELDVVKEENAILKEKMKYLGNQKDLYNTLSVELKKVLDSLTDLGVQKLPGDGWRFGVDLLFKSGSSKISDKGLDILKKFAEVWKGQPVAFRIEGHTDKDPIVKSGKVYKTKTNLELGCSRSLAVMEALLKSGVPESKLVLVSKGNSNPIAPNDDKPENKRKNRRVEIYVLQ